MFIYHLLGSVCAFLLPFGEAGPISNCTADGDVTGSSCGYITVRKGAHMFWWLHRSTHDDGYRERPWILWLQGGPGLAGSGLGNFLEIGPFDENLNPRATTWLRRASVLFVDSPVGVGFSYLDQDASVATGLTQISQDLVSFLKDFLTSHQEFKKMPLYIFGQSDGGRMAVGLGYQLAKATMDGSIDIDLQGLGIGNGFVSASHFVNAYGPFLYETSIIDERGLREMTATAERFTDAVSQGVGGYEIEHLFGDVLSTAQRNAGGALDIYNIMDGRLTSSRGTALRSIYDVNLGPFMNNIVKPRLGIVPEDVRWQGFSAEVYRAQYDDAYVSVHDKVDWLLENTTISVAVYQGQMDMICATPGAMAWIQALRWAGLGAYNRANRTALADPSTHTLEMFVKAHHRLKFYWILGSGHAVPADRPGTALRMVSRILDNVDH